MPLKDPVLKKQYQKEYYLKNRQNLKEQFKNYHLTHKDQILDRHKEYRHDKHDQIRETNKRYQFKKEHEDITFKLARRLRNRLYTAIRNKAKRGSAVKDLGCSIPELIKYTEKQFKPGMTWNNWTTDGWHMDHIKPLSKFDLNDRKQLLEAINFSNLQPMWSKENIVKSNKSI